MAIWAGKGASKKCYKVKVKKMRIEGLKMEELMKDQKRVMEIQMKWDGFPKRSGISSLYRKPLLSPTREVKPLLILGIEEQQQEEQPQQQEQFIDDQSNIDDQDEEICDDDDDDDDGFVKVCNFNIVSKDPICFGPCFVSFNILCGESESTSSSRSKMQVVGKVSLNLGELASKLEAQIEQKVPVALQMDGVAIDATLRIVVSFVEMKNSSSSHSRTPSHDLVAMSPSDSTILLRRAMSQGPSLGQEKPKKNKLRLFGKQWSFRNSDESQTTSNSESEYVVVASSSSKNGESNSMTELGSSPSSEAQLDLVKKGGFWKWKRRRSKKQAENSDNRQEVEKAGKVGIWEARDLVSRDGKTKLNANVFFASYDQRGEKAAGKSACAAIVAVVAHWLQSNPGVMPTGSELDNLITEGSSEWRKLCEDESHKEFFPDHHFDLETILEAELRPLAVHPSNSRFGFFHPEEFEHLKDALSFDDIWEEINKNISQHESSVYIVRWNDHFFILKVEANANYIIDSLGERLHEGCNQAYILKFDDSTVMYEKNEENEGGKDTKKEEKREDSKVICRGKECCKEYMKRFLAAIPLRELKEEEQKGKTVDVFSLYQRLQIDFHLSTPTSSTVSTANTSVSASPNASPAFLVDEEYVEV